MLRAQKSIPVVVLFAVAFAALLCAAPAFAAPQGQVCPASPPSPEPMAPPFFKRTCRCSCGYPCSTNADCGPGGICSAGITCC